ncbi:DUF2207 family protein [Levilactobacillus spicheri]
MKFWQNRWWLLIIGLIIGWTGVVQAHADYTIEPYRMAVQVTKDGNATVTQTMTYDFDDDYHGVFNVQDLRGIQGGRLTGVTTQLNHQAPVTARAGDQGATNTYRLTKTADRVKVKLYRPVTDSDQLKVTYRWHLRGVVANYRDTAELNWKVIGTGWSEPLNHVRITIQLPAKQIAKLQAWTHGPLDGHTTVDRQAGRVTMTVGQNPAESFVESHLLFPTTVMPGARVVDRQRKAAAQKQEAQLVAAANAKRSRRQHLLWGGLGGIWLLTLVAVVAAGVWVRRHPAHAYVHPIPIPHAFDVPSVSPAVAESLLDYQSPTTDALAGEILMAVTRREITLEPVQDGRHATMRLTKIGDVQNSFLWHCFDRVAQDDTSFTLRDLKKYGKRDKKGRLGKWFQHWQDDINRDVEVYQDGENIALRDRLAWIRAGLTGLFVLCAVLGWLVSPTWGGWPLDLVMMVLMWIVVTRQRRRIDRYNQAGLELANNVGGFRRMLKDIGHFNTAQIGDLILWEEILPYAAAFGLAKQVAAKLAVDFDSTALQTQFMLFYPLYIDNNGLNLSLGDALNTGLSGALDASGNASSSSGSSGGFSGGSSGGFGGGSGGGAF